MNTAKLVGLLLISFIATGSVVYNLRARRRPAPAVAFPAPGTPAIPAPAATPSPAPPITPPPTGDDVPKITIPPNTWGRNPFLTVDEINKLNQPQPVVVERPVERNVEPAGLPVYSVTGIVSGAKGLVAIVDSRLVRAGDRLGSETVKEIKSAGVVLESPGQTRELPLKRMEDTAVAAPKKEAKK